MSSWFEALGFPAGIARGLQILIAIAIAAVLVRIAWRFGGWAVMPRGRRRQGSRLAVVELLAVDDRRSLALVRRDGVEHLLLIGGANDLVVEAAIGTRRPDEARPAAAPSRAAPPAAAPAFAEPAAPALRAAAPPEPAPERPAAARRPAGSASPAAAAPVAAQPPRPAAARIRPPAPPLTPSRATPRAPAEGRLDLDAWGEALQGEGPGETAPALPPAGHRLLRRPGAPAAVEPFLPEEPFAPHEPPFLTEGAGQVEDGPALPPEPRLFEGDPFEPGTRPRR